MKRILVVILGLVILAGVGFAAAKEPYSLQVKKLYAVPEETASVVFDIPIDVKLLDMSNDGNWYKVRIAFNFGPLGYTYVGWAKIPVGDILAARMEKIAKASPAEEAIEE
ncbi:MAG: hypothetical protein MUC35_02480 [Candidatus Margulisbacteria bacterium]|jgi:hypothetical protein|nr:hypothetical protein [Candidatus Margulisiibacteriota bacterium]